MKAVFLPVSDELLNDQSFADVQFVPFNPEFLNIKPVVNKDRKPRNWISNSSYEDALNRLRGAQSAYP